MPGAPSQRLAHSSVYEFYKKSQIPYQKSSGCIREIRRNASLRLITLPCNITNIIFMKIASPTAENLMEEQTVNLPPHSLQAEQAILGGIMLNDQAWDNIDLRLHERDFYDPQHQRIFRTMHRLIEDGKAVDAITVANMLEAEQALESVGGAAYLAELAQNIGNITNVPTYARIVKNHSILRRLIQAGNEIVQNAFRSKGRDFSPVIDEAERCIYQIGDAETILHAPQQVGSGTAKVVRRIEELMQTGSTMTGISTGYPKLDNLLCGLNANDLIIIAARPGCGKTAFALNLIEHIIQREPDSGVLLFSLEMSSEPIIMRMLSSMSGVHHHKIRTGQINQDNDLDKIIAQVGVLDKAPLYLDEVQGLTVTEIRSRIRRVSREMQQRYNVRLGVVMVDYLQLIQSNTSKRYDTRASEIGEISRTLKSLAKEFNVAMVAMSQLNRAIEARANKLPVLSDLRESGSIEQDADIIIFLHNPKDKGQDQENHDAIGEHDNKPRNIDLLVRKNRNGRTGKVPTLYIPHLLRFENRAEEGYTDSSMQFHSEGDEYAFD